MYLLSLDMSRTMIQSVDQIHATLWSWNVEVPKTTSFIRFSFNGNTSFLLKHFPWTSTLLALVPFTIRSPIYCFSVLLLFKMKFPCAKK